MLSMHAPAVNSVQKNLLVKYAGVFAAIAGATLAITKEASDIRSAVTGTDHTAFNMAELMTEGSILAVLGAGMAFLAVSLYRRTRQLETERQSNVDGKTRISFQMDAMKRHTIISETNPDGRLQNVNENWENMFGYKKSEVIGQFGSFLFEDGIHDPTYITLRETVANGQVFSGEQKLVTKSGKVVVVQTTTVPMFDSDGNHIRTISMRTDITASKTAESDRFMVALLKEFPDEVYIYDMENYQIVYMNDLALGRCGWTSREAKQRTIADSSKWFDVTVFESYLRPLLEGKERAVTVRTKHEKGYVEITTRIHRQPDNTPVFMSVLRDITAEKLEEKRKLQTVAGVSHELRSPLTSIKGSLRLLNSGAVGDLDAKASRLVDIADRNTDRMLTFLNDILDFEKIIADKMEFDLVSVNLRDFVNDAIELNKGYADEHDVHFVAGDIPEGARVKGDSGRLTQVITNLMTNAAKFSPPGEEILISVSDQGNAWRVNVADKGPGIPLESREKVFQSFTQLEPVDGKARKGTGLGLAISKKIVDYHSGNISFDSVIGEGTDFFFELPKEGAEFAIAAE
jgi:two-component system, OmpR family, sensor histidine kinase VicK